MDADEHRDLGLPALREALAARARTDLGKARALCRPLGDDRAAVAEALAWVEEARTLVGEGRTLPLGGASDVREWVRRAAKGAILEPRELVATAGVLHASAQTKDFLQARAERVPRLTAVGARLCDLTTVARRIEAAFEPSGELADRASPALGQLRERTRGLHRDIKVRLEGLLADHEVEPHLRDRYFTLRNERYVVPVLASARAQVPGIVHNASQSGQTLFVEPQALIGLGNELAIAQSMATEEERRVLQELAASLGARSAEILESLEALAELDEAEACARLANDLLAHAPILTGPVEPFELKGLRHPLLVLQGKQVVPSDVRLSPPARALIVSGPNAGGKTVTLTGVGLCALMVRLGLPIPAAEGSRMPLYGGIHAAIGDAQDLARDLSTFSAHVAALREILAVAGPGSLVLIDEMAADTDPREGAALAAAVLGELLARGATALVTTHLDELKALGLADPRFANAHVGFDATRLAPTYALHLGTPGASSAIEIARRVGLSEAICERARQSLRAASGPLAQALEALDAARRDLDRERGEVERAADEARRKEAAATRKLAELEEQTRRGADEARTRLLADLERAQVAVSAMVAELQVQPSLARAAEVQHALRRREAEERAQLAAAPPAPPEERGDALQIGGRVKIGRLDREGELLALHGGEAVVQAGALRMRVPASELTPLRGKPRSSARLKGAHTERMRRAHEVAVQAVDEPVETCDVRGMRADEALRRVEAFLDRLYGEGRPSALIVHGHGTGALKTALREHLVSSPYVASWSPGAASEGGDGATRIALRG